TLVSCRRRTPARSTARSARRSSAGSSAALRKTEVQMRSSLHSLALGFVSALSLAAAGCGGAAAGTTYSVEFVPLVGGAPFSCTQTYPNIGTTQSTISPQDFRMYVSGVNLVRAGGEQVPLALEADNTWQGDDIALLDFEDGTGG